MAASGVPQFASLYVGDLHADVTEAMLYEIFNSVGPVASIRVCRDSVSRRSLGYGYVNYHSVADAEKALDTLNYSSIKGRSCRIMWSQRDPSLRKSGAGNIYVRNLDKNIDNKALYDTFSLFGNILSCKVASDSTGKSHGYGFVHYETEEAAKQAIERVNGMQIGEKTVEVTQFLKKNEREPATITNYTNLYVKNFPDAWDEDKIKEVFAVFGSINSLATRKDNKGRPFAFVNFEKNEDALKAVEDLHMKEMRTPDEIEKAKEDGKEDEMGLDGHPVGKLYVQRAQSKTERQKELQSKFGTSERVSDKPQGVNLYVKNLDDDTDEAALRALFEPFGAITSAAAPLDDKGKCKGFGFVAFASPDEATKAVTDMHLKVVKGKPLYVGLAEKREARQERLRQRYSGGGMSKGGGGKGGKGGKGGQPMMGGGMYGGPQGMMQPPMGMMGKGGAMMGGNPQMMGMMNPAMMGMMGKGGPGMPGMGGMPMMPAGKGGPGMQQMPQQMQQQQMGKGGPPMGPGGPMMGGAPGPQGPGGMGPGGAGGPGAPINASSLAAAPPALQKQMIGEKLYPAIAKYQPELAGKITGMMLEMDNSELLILLDSEQQLKGKVDEALRVLEAPGRQ
mmetsp:Transcript_48729/g.110984  ORF Transcript_48729/g.110984 Transcript_48729/m.110984 type:complete len:619 (+) Transcript_48729:65-1921(+)